MSAISLDLSEASFFPEIFNGAVERPQESELELQRKRTQEVAQPFLWSLNAFFVALASALNVVTRSLVVVSAGGLYPAWMFCRKQFFQIDARFFHSDIPLSEKMGIALFKAERLGRLYLDRYSAMRSFCLGGAMGAAFVLGSGGVSLLAVGSGLLCFAGSIYAYVQELKTCPLVPVYQECFAKLYDSMMRSLFSANLSQEELQQRIQHVNRNAYPLPKELVNALLEIYQKVAEGEDLNTPNAPVRKQFEAFRLHSTYLFQLCFKHLLPLMSGETILALIQQYPELGERRFLEECRALHPSRMPESLIF